MKRLFSGPERFKIISGCTWRSKEGERVTGPGDVRTVSGGEGTRGRASLLASPSDASTPSCRNFNKQ